MSLRVLQNARGSTLAYHLRNIDTKHHDLERETGQLLKQCILATRQSRTTTKQCNKKHITPYNTMQ